MCRDLTIWFEDDDGQRIEALPVTELGEPPVACTCWLLAEAGPATETWETQERQELEQWFLNALRPYVQSGIWGRIVIEIH